MNLLNARLHADDLKVISAEYNRRVAMLESCHANHVRLLEESEGVSQADFDRTAELHTFWLDKAEGAWLAAWRALSAGSPVADVLRQQRGW